MPPTSTTLPTTLVWAVRLLALEAAAAGVAAGFFAVRAVAGDPTDRGDALAVAGFVALAAATLGGLALALARRRPRARAPAIVLQLLMVMLGYVLVTGGVAWAGVPAGLLGVAVTTLLLAPRTGAALE